MKKVTRRALRGHFHSPVVPAGHGNLRRIRDPSARGDEVRILRLRSQARFAQDDISLRRIRDSDAAHETRILRSPCPARSEPASAAPRVRFGKWAIFAMRAP